MLIIGAREAESGEVAMRIRGQGDIGSISLEEVMKQIQSNVDARSHSPGEI